VDILAPSVRWVLFVSTTSLVGALAYLVVVARPAVAKAGPDVAAPFAGLDARLVRFAGWSLVVALAGGVLDLVRQAASVSGLGLRESLSLPTLSAVLLETRYGAVWLVRQATLLLLGLLLFFREGEEEARDSLALRLEALMLGVVSLTLGAAAGHAASTDQTPLLAMSLDAVHLIATGVWLGGLLPMALGLAWTATLPAPEGPRLAARMTARFSSLGLVAVGCLVVTGGYATWAQVGSVPALIGSPYGRWLLLKLGLFALILAVAAVNLLALRPRLTAAAEGRAAAAGAVRGRLRRQVLTEAGLGAAVLGVVAVLGLTTPARHDQFSWPLSFRLAWEATRTLPGVQTRVAVGSQIAVLGLVTMLIAAIVRRPRRGVAALAGGMAIILGASLSLPAIAVDANPATYLRPSVPYAAASIVEGRRIYRADCASCHGVAGWGDGPAAPGLRPPPADLTAKHAGDHTAGDLFWWVSRGIPGSAMPGFANRLSPEARWDVINYARLLGSAEAARRLSSEALGRPTVVAPDFAFTTGVGGEGDGRALRDLRGRGPVLLVLFTLPGSVDRLTRLNEAAYTAFKLAGGEIIGIPIGPLPDLYRRLGDRPIFFPLVVDGASEAAETYLEFRRDLTAPGQLPDPPPPSHLELLVDRQGYLRARWMPEAQGGWTDPARLLTELERLSREVPTAPPPGEHVH
jgi:putative copper resistance protein D